MQELYSKVCVAGSIKFVVSKEREEEVDESFSCHLATIFAREQEVVPINVLFIFLKPEFGQTRC